MPDRMAAAEFLVWVKKIECLLAREALPPRERCGGADRVASVFRG
jgi:hypothetical protein